jgi:DNA-binding transcriptional LysR family regulator
MLDDLSLFITIVDCGSFTKAAQCCDIYPSKLSRRLQMLEDSLGHVLIDRTVKNSVVLTEAGKILYTQFQGSFARLNNRLKELDSLFNDKFGDLKLILPPIFANEFILPKLTKFTNRYPQINLNIIYSTHDVSLMDGNFNIALTSVSPSRGDYRIRTVFHAHAGLFASTKYLTEHGTPQSLEELTQHKIILPIVFNRIFDHWVLTDSENIPHNVYLENHQLIYDSSLAGINLVKHHFGISPLLNFNVHEYIADGSMQRVLPEYNFEKLPFYLVKPNDETSENVNLIERFLRKILELEY